MQSAIYPAVRDGLIVAKDITPDNLHPNDMGHELVASVINYFLDRTLQEVLIGEEPAFVKGGFPEPITANTYEDALRIDNRNYKAFSVGFSEDESIQQDITDCFKNGWLSGGQKCEITFEVECSGAAIQYRKYVSNNAPIAKVFVDDEKVAELDANFEETWGDKLELTTVMEHRELKNHKIKLVLEDCKNTKNPFNLVSVILAR